MPRRYTIQTVAALVGGSGSKRKEPAEVEASPSGARETAAEAPPKRPRVRAPTAPAGPQVDTRARAADVGASSSTSSYLVPKLLDDIPLPPVLCCLAGFGGMCDAAALKRLQNWGPEHLRGLASEVACGLMYMIQEGVRRWNELAEVSSDHEKELAEVREEKEAEKEAALSEQRRQLVELSA